MGDEEKKDFLNKFKDFFKSQNNSNCCNMEIVETNEDDTDSKNACCPNSDSDCC